MQKPPFVKSGRIVCQIAVTNIRYTGADVDHFLGINTSTVNRLAVSDYVSKVEKLLNRFGTNVPPDEFRNGEISGSR